MMTLGLSAIALASAYLIGSIPFGYLIARWSAGIDIRSVGSGNIGATNVGRVLGFRFFLLVTILDAAKGLLPTLFFPRLVGQLTGQALPDLPPLVALAAVIGHNFPVYLRFKGGKGVATSLGAVFGLDWLAGVAAVFGFLIFLLMTRFVSMASILGGLVFVGVHFMQFGDSAFDRDQATLSVLILGMMALLIARHRKNLGRIATGTEPKVSLRKKRSPSGRVRVGLIFLILAAAAGTVLAINASIRPELLVDGRRLVEVDRLATGHQRAERLAFLDGGRLLAVTCPRYMRVVLARVTDASTFQVVRDIPLEGRPVALAESKGRLFVLMRPHGDARHLEEAWWETFDLEGRPIDSKFRVGWDPDDLALSADGRHAYVLSSGLAEGETNRPAPALLTFDIASKTPHLVGRLPFDGLADDPERLAILPNGKAAVALHGSNQVARIDLSDPTSPRLIDRLIVPPPGIPDSLAVGPEGTLLVGDPDASAFWRVEGKSLVRVEADGGVADLVVAEGLILATLPRGSGLGLFSARDRSYLGKLPIRGAANLSTTRPLAITYSAERKLLAVSNRAGGSVHLIAIDPSPGTRESPGNEAGTR